MEKTDCLCIPWNMILDDSMFGHVYKFLILNLQEDSFEVIKNEDNDCQDGNPSISKWLEDFAENNRVHPDDVSAYRSFTSIEKIRKHFQQSHRYMYVRYRRKNPDKRWTWTTMDIFIYPQEKLDPDRLILIVRDIDSDYSRELTRQKNMETECNTDSLTGIHNRFSYINRCRELYETNQSVGVIYCDLNGLKFLNDNFGHEEGDRLIRQMAKTMVSAFRQNECFRIGGDEFVVLLADIEKENFEFRARAFEEYIEKKSGIFLLACSGFAWTQCGRDLEDAVKQAEKIMYQNKKIFHESESGSIVSR